MADEQTRNPFETYVIKIHGHLDAQWSEWFYGMAITYERDGVTTLSGPLPDQTVLYSVLDRIRDMNLRLKSVDQIVPDGQTTKDEVTGASDGEQHINIT